MDVSEGRANPSQEDYKKQKIATALYEAKIKRNERI